MKTDDFQKKKNTQARNTLPLPSRIPRSPFPKSSSIRTLSLNSCKRSFSFAVAIPTINITKSTNANHNINGANTAVFQDASVQFLLFLDLSICMILVFILSLIYPTRAISGRSRLVAAPLRNHAKRQFL